MLGKDTNQNQESETIIGPSVKVKGNFNSEGNVKIEGCLSGTLDTIGIVRIGSASKVKANITAKEIYISGMVDGILKASEKITLSSSAQVNGDIESKKLVIEDGALFSGKCLMTINAKKEILDKFSEKNNKKITDNENKK